MPKTKGPHHVLASWIKNELISFFGRGDKHLLTKYTNENLKHHFDPQKKRNITIYRFDAWVVVNKAVEGEKMRNEVEIFEG